MSADCRNSCPYIAWRQAEIDNLDESRQRAVEFMKGFAGLISLPPNELIDEVSSTGFTDLTAKYAEAGADRLAPVLAEHPEMTTAYFKHLDFIDRLDNKHKKAIENAENRCTTGPSTHKKFIIFGQEVSECHDPVGYVHRSLYRKLD